jgi:hypothetical protein
LKAGKKPSHRARPEKITAFCENVKASPHGPQPKSPPRGVIVSEVERREDGWWITGLPEDVGDCGPYDTKASAEDDRRGMERFTKYEGKEGYLTVDY